MLVVGDELEWLERHGFNRIHGPAPYPTNRQPSSHEYGSNVCSENCEWGERSGNPEDRSFEKQKFEICRFISKSDFEKKQSDFLSSEFLTVVCTLGSIISTGIAKLEKLSDDLKDMMVSGYHSDIIIKVRGEEFRLHKNILGARSGYFDSMFNSNMKEMKTVLVSNDDCEPDLFRSFIHYLYTGKVVKLTPENVFDLYDISEKYQEDQLKEICLRYMMNSITIDSLSDFFILAMRHDEGDYEKKFIEKAAKFFADNTKEIIRSEKWLAFMKKYPEYSVALHTKALDAHGEDDES